MNTDDLQEGEVQLFHTPERVQAAMFHEEHSDNELVYLKNNKLKGTGLKMQFGGIDTRTAQIHSSETLLNTSKRIHLDFNNGQNFDVKVQGDIHFMPFKNAKNGAFYTLRLTHFTAVKKITFDKRFLFPSGEKPQFSSQPDSVDILSFYSDGTYLYGALLKDFRPCL